MLISIREYAHPTQAQTTLWGLLALRLAFRVPVRVGPVVEQRPRVARKEVSSKAKEGMCWGCKDPVMEGVVKVAPTEGQS